MERLIIYTSSQNTSRGRGKKYWHIIIHFQVGEAGYSITIVQIYNALKWVGPQERVFCQCRALCCRCSPGCHLTNTWLIRSVGQHTCTFLLNMSCFEYIKSPHPDITTRRSSATCQLPKSTCYLATIIEASSKECSLFSLRMALIPAFHTSIHTSQVRCVLVPFGEISLISLPNQWWGRGGGFIMYHRVEEKDRL